MKIRRFFKWLAIVLAGAVLLLCLGWLCLPKGTRETMEFDDPDRENAGDFGPLYGVNGNAVGNGDCPAHHA